MEGRLPVIEGARRQYSSRALCGNSPSSKRSSTSSTTSLISPIHAACICCPSRNVALMFLCWRARERSRTSSECRTDAREDFVDIVDWRRAFESSSAWTERARRLSRKRSPLLDSLIDGLEVGDLRLPWREVERRRGTRALAPVVVSDLRRLRGLDTGSGSALSFPSSSSSSSASTSVYVGGASLEEGDVTFGEYSGKIAEDVDVVVGDVTSLGGYRLRCC